MKQLTYKPSIRLVLVLLGLLFARPSFAQVTDLARLEYMHIPQANSENSVSRVRALINYPMKLGWEGSYLIVGLEYRSLDLDFKDPVPFDVDNLGKFQLLRGTTAYTFKMKNDWRAAAKVGIEINSNFERNTIISDDVNFSGAVFMIKDKTGDEHEKPSRFIIGLNYSTNQGRPFPLPVINYYRKFHPNWSYSIGTPKTNLKYFAGNKHTLQAFITLDGFFSNIQNNLPVDTVNPNSAVANNISMTLVLGGIGYEYGITKHLLLYAYGGHTFYNEIRLRDTNRNSLYKINEENTFYLRGGIKFKL